MGKCLRTDCQKILPENVSYCDDHKYVSSTTTRNEMPIPSDGGLTPPAPAPADAPEISRDRPGSGLRPGITRNDSIISRPGSQGPKGGRGGSGGGFGGFGGGGPGGGF